MVKHTQTIRRQKPTNCLSISDHFVGLVLKGLSLGSLGSVSFAHNLRPISLERDMLETWNLVQSHCTMRTSEKNIPTSSQVPCIFGAKIEILYTIFKKQDFSILFSVSKSKRQRLLFGSTQFFMKTKYWGAIARQICKK